MQKEEKSNAYWISCYAHFLCRVDALAPAAPTSRSSRSNWQSSWRESLWAGARRGFLSPLHCPDQTARPWSSSVSPDWPAIHEGSELRSITVSTTWKPCQSKEIYILYYILLLTLCSTGNVQRNKCCTSIKVSVGSRFKRDAVGVSSCSCLSRK